MKRVLLGLVLAAAVITGAAEDAPAPSMPSEVKLTSGRVLRNVSVIRWESQRVVLKHAGGADPIHFSLIAEPLRSQLAAIRETEKKAAAAAAAEIKRAEAAGRTITGQLFVVTRGRANYLMGDLTVYFVPREEMEKFTKGISRIEYEAKKSIGYVSMGGSMRPVAPPEDVWLFKRFEEAPRGTIRSRTNGEGRFTVRLPIKGEFYAFARDSRLVWNHTEWYVWLKLIGPDDSAVTLSNSDLWVPTE